MRSGFIGMQINGARSRGRIMSEINVTPFVDVMLVLLIIFMVAALMMIQGIDVKLPEASSRPILTETEKIPVSVTADGRVHIDNEEVELGMLRTRLYTMQNSFHEKCEVILRADRKVEYGLVAQIMGAIREAGIQQIGMVTEPLTEGATHSAPESRAAETPAPGSTPHAVEVNRGTFA